MEEPLQSVIHATMAHKQASLRTYISGFMLSIFLTLVAYIATVRQLWNHHLLVGSLLALAVAQFFVQVFFFLHLGHETKPRWKLLLMFMMIVIVLILVLGSIWIMYSLNYRMTPEQMNTYLLKQDGGI